MTKRKPFRWRVRYNTGKPNEEEGWHQEYRIVDFNNDDTLDIVPHYYPRQGSSDLAWLNDGTGHYVTLETSQYTDEGALNRFASGPIVRVGSDFKAMKFFGDGTELRTSAGVIVEDALITHPD